MAALSGVLRDKAVARGGVRALYTDYDLLGEFSAGSYVFRQDFIKKNPDTVRAFVAGVAKAIEWSRSTPRSEVIARFEKIINAHGRNEDTSTLRYFKSFGVAGQGGLISDKEFSTWIDWLDRSGELKGKQVSAANVYTNEFNPFAAGAAK